MNGIEIIAGALLVVGSVLVLWAVWRADSPTAGSARVNARKGEDAGRFERAA